MKNKTRITRNLIFVSAFLTGLAVAVGAIAYPGGSPAGYTGSPGDGQNCVSCHGGSASTVTNWITSNIPPEGYTPGSTYTITVTVSGTGKKGFEVSPQSVSGTQLGVLAAGTGNHLVGGTKYVTQNSSGSSSGTATWSFSWTAPAAGTGQVTFYGAFTVNKPVTKLSTLVVQENAAVPLAASASASPDLVCNGQGSQLTVTPAGGTGNYTFAWTSVPPGFTSTQQNPSVSPVVTTQYNVTVSDGASSVNASATVTVAQPPLVNAGSDTTCAYSVAQVPLAGTGANYTLVTWTTSGTGVFTAPNALAGFYNPSDADRLDGQVTLTLTATAPPPCMNPATDSRIVTFEGPNGISFPSAISMKLGLAPNPSAGLITIRIPSAITGTLTISDMAGRSVAERQVRTAGPAETAFDLRSCPRGLYLVRLVSGTHMASAKLALE